LGWSQYQVRSDRAMRRHWALVQCAFAFCWWAEPRPPQDAMPQDSSQMAVAAQTGERGEKERTDDGAPLAAAVAVLAAGLAPRAGLAGASAVPVALLAGVVERASAAPAASPPRLAPPGPSAPPL